MAALVLVVLLFVGVWILRAPTPIAAATSYGHALVSGDTDWIYEHAFDEEKAEAGFTRDLVRDFYDTFLRKKLAGSSLVGEPSVRQFSDTMAAGKVTVRLRNGKTTKFGVFAFAEDRQVRVGVLESLLYAASDLNYGHLGPHPAPKKAGWKNISPWLIDRGIKRIYSSQDGGFIVLSK